MSRAGVSSGSTAQRRPGLSPRRHSPSRERPLLNEGRGSHPGDTPHRTREDNDARSLNEGRGSHPGDTLPTSPCRGSSALRRPDRSTKAGALTPATPAWRIPFSADARPLNEGRGSRDGQARPGERRPGLSPRRHGRDRHAGHPLRSTKAGALTPATPALRGMRPCSAQRRPGLSPRRHGLGPRHATKAGALTPATPLPFHRRQSLNEGRGSHPGDTGALNPQSLDVGPIAQRRPGLSPRRHCAGRSGRGAGRGPLNEGRGSHPGDTRLDAHDLERRPVRSTKAGALTPATLGRGCATRSTKPWLHPGDTYRRFTPPTLNEGRGSHPGDTGNLIPGRAAQRRPGLSPRRHSSSCAGLQAPTLNEGRGSHPGDTSPGTPPPPGTRCSSLNEGRGSHPGDTSARFRMRCPAAERSTKAGALTPATHGRRALLNEGRGSHPGAPPPSGSYRARCRRVAQRRPGLSPRRHKWGHRTTVQRRPGLSPRRHPVDGQQRSTKAGALTPATPSDPACTSTKAGALTPATVAVHAQRRPGLSPRRHQVHQPPCPNSSAKPAQRRPGLSPRRHWSGRGATSRGRRSTKAGALTPATRASDLQDMLTGLARSTKAGALTPATPREGREARSTPLTPATHPPAQRSTKAGALTPATLGGMRRPPPGGLVGLDAQRRPGLSPRRHLRTASADSKAAANAQRRPGLSPRRHAEGRPVTAGPRVPRRAQRRPGLSPRRHQYRASDALLGGLDSWTTAQRRPGLSPRRHRKPSVLGIWS